MKKSLHEMVQRTRGRGTAAMNVVSQDWLFLQQPAGRMDIAANDAHDECERKVA